MEDKGIIKRIREKESKKINSNKKLMIVNSNKRLLYLSIIYSKPEKLHDS